MPEVFVAAGSNVEPRTHLRRALALMRESWPGLLVSSAYANRSVGFAGDDFINLVAGFATREPLAAVLARLHAIEAACGPTPGRSSTTARAITLSPAITACWAARPNS